MSELSEQLLDAHVAHMLARMRGEPLAQLLRERVSSLFAWFEDVKLGQVMTPGQIMAIIDRYVIELRVSGGITELAGQMSKVIFSSAAAGKTRLGDVLTPQSYEDFADKIVGLPGLRKELIHGITHSNAFSSLTTRVLARMVTDLLFQPRDGALGSRMAGVLGTLTRRVLPDLEQRVGASLSRTLERQAQRLARESERVLLETLDQETVREVADEVWGELSKHPLSEVSDIVSPQDLEDFVVLVYEFWLKFRKSGYFRAVASEVVEQFFAKYGQESLAQVIDDMGVDERMVSEELITSLGPLLEQALSTGFLEQELRAILAPFYRSPTVDALLAR